MIQRDDQGLTKYADILEGHLDEFVMEMQAVDLVDLVGFIRFESFPTVEDLVNSATELFFKPDMLTFSWVAGADVRWDALPAVTLGMEFRHPRVSVFFNLVMRDTQRRVEVLSISFDKPRCNGRAVLARALADARLTPVKGRVPVIPAADAARPLRRDLPWT